MTKFSEELIALQMALLLFTSAFAAYLLLIRKKKKESAEWVPAALVRAYLDRVRSDERDTRFKLFGEQSAVAGATAYAPLTTALSGGTSMDPALLKEVEALRSQLTLADQKTMEFDRMMNALRAEKSALEAKLKEAQASPAAAGAAANPAAAAAAQKEVDELKARLQEYEVIEDDLANLKKFQKENELLKQKVQALESGGATTVAAAPPATEEKMVVSGGAAEKPAMTLVSGGATPEPTPAPANVDTNVLAPITPSIDTAPAAAAPEKSAQQKEEELLSEFEKMLAS